MLAKWITGKKEELIGLRVSKEFKEFLKKKADEKGLSLSELLENNLVSTYKTDKEIILEMIDRHKREQPLYWEQLSKSPILRVYEEYIPTLIAEFLNPIANNIKNQPVQMMLWIECIINATTKHFDSIDDEYKSKGARQFFGVANSVIEAFPTIKAKDKELQEEIIKMKIDMAERICYQLTTMVFAKDSYNTIRAELEKVQVELLKELGKK